jgi:GMP synthase-like glutamine amidotransferase
VWEPLRSRHGDYPEMFERLLIAGGGAFDLNVFAVHADEWPAQVAQCDAWLISGSRAAVYDPLPWIAPLMEFVRRAVDDDRPIVGICFGHQLLAHALGGRAERAVDGWGLGNIETRMTAQRRRLAALPDALSLFMAHQDQVTALPPGAELLAATAHCPHAMFALGPRVLGIQAHPEFDASFMRAVTVDPTFEVAPTLRAEALTSYARPADSACVARALVEFLGLDTSVSTNESDASAR